MVREFNSLSAWTLGVGFFAGRAAGHAAILIGLGILLPLGVQFLLAGAPTGLLNPAASGGATMAGTMGMTATSGAEAIATVIGFVLQIASYLASWRLGFATRDSVGRAVLFGLAVASLLILALALVSGVLGYAVARLSPTAGMVVVGLVAILFIATLASMLAAMLAAAAGLILLVAMILGTASGNLGFAATMVGGSGFVVVILVVAAGLLLWAAGRPSCTTAVLADRKSFDLLAAMRESWRLTWDEEWRIMRYIAVLGIVFTVVLMGAGTAAGAGLAGFPGGVAELPGVRSVAQILVSVPLAYLTVLVPAGVYRELVGLAVPAEVFA